MIGFLVTKMDISVGHRMRSNGFRHVIMGEFEDLTALPEYRHMDPWWNQRSRGFGATPSQPVGSSGEENAMEEEGFSGFLILNKILSFCFYF